MRHLSSAVAVLALVSTTAIAGETAASASATATVLSAPADIKWTSIPEMPGMQLANVHGDPKTGPNTGFVKFAGGTNIPLHHHSAEHKGVVLAGTFVIATEDGTAKELPAGSFLLLPGGVKHTTSCKAGADCVIFAVLDGPDDAVLAFPPPAAGAETKKK